MSVTLKNIGTLVFLALACITVLSAQVKEITIDGKTNSKNNGLTVYVLYQYQNAIHTDSVIIKNEGFTYRGQVDGPTSINLILKHRNKPFNLFNDNTDKFTTYIAEGNLKLSFADQIKNASYSGNKMALAYKEYNDLFTAVERSYKEGSTANGGKKMTTEDYLKARREIQKEYLKKNPSSYFALLALSDMTIGRQDVNVDEPLFNSLSEEVRSTPMGQTYKRQLDRARPTAIGAIAPEFAQTDINGKSIGLSDFRGQYVLIDFWASWCKPCRAENPFLVSVYQQFKDKNFTILGVSLDDERSKNAWIKAVEQDKLTWPQISDLKGWKNEAAQLYNISSVPQNFLIAPDGKIVAKNLKGEALIKKLTELL